MQCSCYPGRILCGENGLDFSEWFDNKEEGPYGPGRFICRESVDESGKFTRICEFREPNFDELISQFFGDTSILLDCPVGGECLYYSDVPGYERPEFKQEFSLAVIILLFVGVLGLLGLVFGSLMYVKRRSENGVDGYIPINTLDSEAGQSREAFMTHHRPCTISWHKTSYIITTNKKPVPDASGTNPTSAEVEPPYTGPLKQVVLNDTQGMVRPGEVMAIMGGSGAGKTTLLDILARKNKSGTVTGDILVNDEFMDYNHYREIIGYVDQEDTLMDTLTVYETILCSAMLRLPKSMPIAVKKLRVVETMTELGIIGIANRRIGSSENRGLSGGEKRRVSIACELVTSPSILFLDEPTSGLDTYNAYNVIECLVGLARDYKRSVILTIHQPRSNIYALFDKLVLMSKGHVVYSGPAQQPVIDHFASLGYECPLGFNIADYLVDLTMHAANAVSVERQPQTPAQVSPYSAASPRTDIRAQQEHMLYSPKAGSAGGPSAPSTPRRNELLLRIPGMSDRRTTSMASLVDGVPVTIVGDGFLLPYLSDELSHLVESYRQCSISVDMNTEITDGITRTYPNETLLNTARKNAGQVPAISFTDPSNPLINRIGAVWNQILNPSTSRAGANWWDQFKILSGRTFVNLYRNPDLLRTQYVLSILIAFICGFLFWKLDDTLAGFQNRLGVMFFICALFGFGCLSSMQILFDLLPLRMVPPVILGLICYHMIGLQPEFVLLLRFLLVLVLFNVTSACCCLAISIIFPDQGIASLIATLVMLFEMLFGGLLLNKATVSPMFQWMHRLSFFNYAFEALVVNEVAGLTLVEEKFGFKIDVPGALVLKTFGLDAQGYWSDVQNLAIMCGIFVAIAFVWLHVFVKERR
ncbi:hypothetical protein HDV02_005204 [Globomyces sp. JEL0801]|nr:hypothetical protein HDV02_005204 [Globomyces sp. JEL0801]